MNQNLNKLQEEFLAKNSTLPKLSKRSTRTTNLGGITIILSALIHMANFSFIESLELFIAMIFIPLILLFILHKTGGKNFKEEFDKALYDFTPKLLDSIDGASLIYAGSNIEMNSQEVGELGFLHQNIHASFKPIKKHHIKGKYKNVHVDIFELSYKHVKSKNRGLNLGWKPSTIISFDYHNPCQVNFSMYLKKSTQYRRGSNGISSISKLFKMVHLKGPKVKTGIKQIDDKYLCLISNERKRDELLSDDFLKRLVLFHKQNYRIKGDFKIYDAKFFVLHGNKISVVIFNRKLLYPRIDDIFTAYNEELNSILKFVDVFSNLNAN